MMQPYTKGISSQRRTRERGSALLIVFVFAAVIAIMLYRELPVVLFEAKRQKEELLVDRGHEYVRAIQLFYRRNHQYPASIDQLESTNNVRYLRRRYKDPFTGKDDWRLIHAGPGGMLIDSQVNRGLAGINGAPSMNGSPGMNNSANQSSFAQSGFSSNGNTQPLGASGGSSGSFNSSITPEVVVPDVPQRAPAVQASGNAAGSATPSSADLAQNPDTPLLPQPADAAAAPGGVTGPAPSSAATTATAAGQANNPMQALNPALTSPSPTDPQSQGSAFPSGNAFQQSARPALGQIGGGMGQIGGGALAGVASKAGGHSIKAVDDQRDYAKWEFYYDPTKDRGVSGGGQGGAGTPGNVPTGTLVPQQNSLGQNTSGQNSFGQNTSAQNPSGQNSLGQSSSGQNSGAMQPSTNTGSPFPSAGGFMGQPSLGGRAGQQPLQPPPQPQPQNEDSGMPPPETQPDPTAQPQEQPQ